MSKGQRNLAHEQEYCHSINLIPRTTTMYVLKMFSNHAHSPRKENLATLRFLVMVNSTTFAI